MKIKAIFAIILLVIAKTYAMEPPCIDEQSKEILWLESIIKGTMTDEFIQAYQLARGKSAPSLKAIASLKIAKNKISAPRKKVPHEVRDFIKKIAQLYSQIKSIIKFNSCSVREQNLLLNLVNNSTFNCKKYFPKISKQKTLSKMLLFGTCLNDISYVKCALTLGASVDSTDRKIGWGTALICSAESGNEKIGQLLIDFGANVNAKDASQQTPLMIASYHGNTKFAKLLLENGANVNHLDENGKAALIYAADGNHVAVTQILCKAGCPVNSKNSEGWTALMFATYHTNLKIIKLLIKAGADLNAKNNDGCTALDIAKAHGYNNIVQFFEQLNHNQSLDLEPAESCCVS